MIQNRDIETTLLKIIHNFFSLQFLYQSENEILHKNQSNIDYDDIDWNHLSEIEVIKWDIEVYRRDFVSLLYTFCFSANQDNRLIKDDLINTANINNFNKYKKYIDDSRNGYVAHLHNSKKNREHAQYLTLMRLEEKSNFESYENIESNLLNICLTLYDIHFQQYSYIEQNNLAIDFPLLNKIKNAGGEKLIINRSIYKVIR